jgi:hypothetical protein
MSNKAASLLLASSLGTVNSVTSALPKLSEYLSLPLKSADLNAPPRAVLLPAIDERSQP